MSKEEVDTLKQMIDDDTVRITYGDEGYKHHSETKSELINPMRSVMKVVVMKVECTWFV